jgi:acetyl-CoA acyltransferase
MAKKAVGQSHADKSGNGNGTSGRAPAERIAIVEGLRTPFAKQSTAYRDLSALELGKIVTAELLARADLDPKEVGLVVFGQVVPSVSAPNIAREIVLGTGMPKTIEAFSVSRACATSFQAMTSAAESLLAGQHAVAIAGGADSSSDVPITVSKKLAHALLDASKARTLPEKLKAFAHSRRRTSCPSRPRSRSRRPASPWARAPRRWRKRAASTAPRRTRSHTAATQGPPRRGPTACSRRR